MTRRAIQMLWWVVFALAAATDGYAAETGGAAPSLPAFPGAQGWAAGTPGGRGGRIIRVTTLAASGPGSFVEAVETKGRRVIVFEVGGVIDLGRKTIAIKEPFLTISGQTAPKPGITFIRGGLSIATHDVIVQHIRVRPGSAGAAKSSGWEADGITIWQGHDIIVDHCSLTWATDENLSASGPRFEGASPDDWREHTSHRITFSNNLIAEGLSHSTHSKGEHSKGSLIHDNTADILIVGNLYAHNFERNPLVKGGGRVVIVNNYIFNPGQRIFHYALNADEWGDHPYQTGQIAAVGNSVLAGASTVAGVALFTITNPGELRLYQKDNLVDDGGGKPLRLIERVGDPQGRLIQLDSPPLWPQGLQALPAQQVAASVLREAGATPWDRDANDERIVQEVTARRGRVIDSEAEVGGYPAPTPTRRSFNADEWDLSAVTP